MATLAKVFEDLFTRADTTAATSAGPSTVGTGYVDLVPNYSRILGNKLQIRGVGNIFLSMVWLNSSVACKRSGRVELVLAPGELGNAAGQGQSRVLHLFNPVTLESVSFEIQPSGSIKISTLTISGSPINNAQSYNTLAGPGGSIATYDATVSYIMQVDFSGSQPKSVTCRIVNGTTSAVESALSANCTVWDLDGPLYVGIGTNDNNTRTANYTRLTVYADSDLYPVVPFIVDNAPGGAVTVKGYEYSPGVIVEGGSGAPYSLYVHRKTASAAPTDATTRISGALTTAGLGLYVDAARAASTSYYYFYEVTDGTTTRYSAASAQVVPLTGTDERPQFTGDSNFAGVVGLHGNSTTARRATSVACAAIQAALGITVTELNIAVGGTSLYTWARTSLFYALQFAVANGATAWVQRSLSNDSASSTTATQQAGHAYLVSMIRRYAPRVRFVHLPLQPYLGTLSTNHYAPAAQARDVPAIRALHDGVYTFVGGEGLIAWMNANANAFPGSTGALNPPTPANGADATCGGVSAMWFQSSGSDYPYHYNDMGHQVSGTFIGGEYTLAYRVTRNAPPRSSLVA